jgi:hypothetical protein
VSSLEEEMLRAAVPEEDRRDLARLLYSVARERGDLRTAEAFRSAADALVMGDPELGRMIRNMKPRQRRDLGEALAARPESGLQRLGVLFLSRYAGYSAEEVAKDQAASDRDNLPRAEGRPLILPPELPLGFVGSQRIQPELRCLLW